MVAEGLIIAWLCLQRKNDVNRNSVRWLDIKRTVDKLNNLVDN